MKKIKTSKKVALLSLGLVTALNLPVQAEEVYNLEEVVVTATRTEQKIKETPAAVEVITREDIEKLGAKKLIDALALSPSITVSSAMAGNSVSIRGMSGRYVLILIDGERVLQEGAFTTTNTYIWDRINLDNVERIEIVRGVASSLYGSDAMGGVVNIITKTPGKPEMSVSYSPGRYSDDSGVGYDQYSFRYDTGKTKAGAWSVLAGQSETDKLTKPGSPNSSSYFGTRKYLDLAGNWDLSGERQMTFKASFLNEDMEQSSSASSYNYYDNETQSYSLGLKGKHANGDYGIRTYYGKQTKDQNNLNPNTKVYKKMDENERTAWTLEGWNSNRIGDKHLLTTGGEFRTENYAGTRVGNGEADVDSSALYVQDEYKVNERLLFVPSVRYDHHGKFGSKTSPKLGMTYTMNEHFRLKMNAGKGFKAPTLDDMYIYMSMSAMAPMFSGYVVGNPNLKPEESKNYEISLEGEKGKTFGKLTYFNNDVTNLITSVAVNPASPYTSNYTYVNVNKADIKGVEIEVGQQLDEKLMLKLSHTYLDATDGDTHQRLTLRAKNQASVQLHYDDVSKTGISAVLWHTWAQDYLDSASKKHDYKLWSVSVNKKWNDDVDTYIRVDNIFNKKNYDLNIWGSLVRMGVTMKL